MGLFPVEIPCTGARDNTWAGNWGRSLCLLMGWGCQLPAQDCSSVREQQNSHISQHWRDFPSKEGHKEWHTSLWACQKCDQDWHGGKGLPPNIKMTSLTSKPGGPFLSQCELGGSSQGIPFKGIFERVLLIYEKTLLERFATNILPCHRYPPTRRWVIIHRLLPSAWEWYQQTLSHPLSLLQHFNAVINYTDTNKPPFCGSQSPQSHTATQVRYARLFQTFKPTGDLWLIV